MSSRRKVKHGDAPRRKRPPGEAGPRGHTLASRRALAYKGRKHRPESAMTAEAAPTSATIVTAALVIVGNEILSGRRSPGRR